MGALIAGAVYFLLVFAAGFVLGPVRVLWLAPKVGERAAELLEAPIMLAVIVVAARWTVQRFAMASTVGKPLLVGSIALALLLAAEFSVVLGLRGLRVGGYIAGRDPVAGAVYVLLLGLFAAMPALLCRRRRKRINRATE